MNLYKKILILVNEGSTSCNKKKSKPAMQTSLSISFIMLWREPFYVSHNDIVVNTSHQIATTTRGLSLSDTPITSSWTTSKTRESATLHHVDKRTCTRLVPKSCFILHYTLFCMIFIVLTTNIYQSIWIEHVYMTSLHLSYIIILLHIHS
jgi:hypothetical protein